MQGRLQTGRRDSRAIDVHPQHKTHSLRPALGVQRAKGTLDCSLVALIACLPGREQDGKEVDEQTNASLVSATGNSLRGRWRACYDQSEIWVHRTSSSEGREQSGTRVSRSLVYCLPSDSRVRHTSAGMAG